MSFLLSSTAREGELSLLFVKVVFFNLVCLGHMGSMFSSHIAWRFFLLSFFLKFRNDVLLCSILCDFFWWI